MTKHAHARTNQGRFVLRGRREGLPNTVTFELRPECVREPVEGKSLTVGGSTPAPSPRWDHIWMDDKEEDTETRC